MAAVDPRVVVLRRAYLFLYRAAQLTDDGAAALAVAAVRTGGGPCPVGTPLPDDFPARAKLAAAQYTAVEDVVGADVRELVVAAGISAREASEAIARAES